MIYVITGKTGHGKTAYTIARVVREALLSGKTVYSNTKINPRNMFSKRKYKKLFKNQEIEGDVFLEEDRKTKKILYWQNFSDWAWFENGVVICDEGIVYFNARRWEDMPNQMQMRFVQHRKDKLDLWVNVQHYSFIDKTLRMLCERFLHVEMKFGSTQFKKTLLPRIARVTEIDLATLNKCENLGIDPYNCSKEEAQRSKINIGYKEWFWIKPKIFKMYDTGLKMIESRPEKLIHSLRTCDTCGKEKISHT